MSIKSTSGAHADANLAGSLRPSLCPTRIYHPLTAVACHIPVEFAQQPEVRTHRKPWYVVLIPTRYLNKPPLDVILVFELLASRTRRTDVVSASRQQVDLSARLLNPPTGVGSMTTKYAANADRVLMAAEIAMASINSGTPLVTRAQAEQLLDNYFSLVEQAIPLIGDNPLDRRC
jgi:hypothetical protein